MPIRPGDLQTRFRQASAWVEGFEPSAREVLELTTHEWAQRFSADPVVLPRDLQLPADVPRVILASPDRAWLLQIAHKRINLKWESVENQQVESLDFARVAVEVLQPYLSLSESERTVRLAYVVHRFVRHEAPGRELSTFFCRDERLAGPLNRPENFELHAHKVYEPKGLPRLNSWVRWKTGLVPRSTARGIIVEQDLNTLGEDAEAASFDMQAVSNFFSRSAPEADRIVEVYLAPEPSGTGALRQ